MREASFIGCLLFYLLRGMWLQARDGVDEGAGVVGLGVGEYLVGGARFDDAAVLHDHDAVGEVFHHAKVVGDEEVGEMVVAFEVVEQVEHLGLHRHVEGGYRLVANHQFGVEDEGACDADALPLAAAEFVRVAVVPFRMEADLLHQLQDAVVQGCAVEV